MDWAIGAGYSGLYTNVNQRESAKQDLATLSVLNKEIQADKAEKEQAQLKEQAYYENISKFADQLLAGDRAKINEKAKSMSSMVRNHLKMYGGDLTKFFENGGHKVLGDYKNSIINSEEASTYIDNKKNMERILDMQSKGLGHLINPGDMFNLQKYQENGSGKITFTGMLNEIKMPDTNSLEWGEAITADRIMAEPGNYTKIYANWKLTYPSSGEPKPEDLKAFVNAQYGGLSGTNLQKKQQDFSIYSNERDHEFDKHKYQNDDTYRRERDSVTDYKWEREQKLAEEKQRFDQLQALERDAGNNAAKKSSTSSTGYTNAYGEEISKEQAEAINSGINDWYNYEAVLEDKISSWEDINGKTAESVKAYLGEESLYDNTKGYEDITINRKGIYGGAGATVAKNSFHRVSGSKIVASGDMAEDILKKHGAGIVKIDENGGIKIDLEKQHDIIASNGVMVRNLGNDQLNPNPGFFSSNTVASKIKDSTFKTIGIFTGVMGKDKNGNDILATEIVKSGDNTAVDQAATKAWKDRNYQKDKKQMKFRSTMLVGIKDEKDQVFYIPLNNDAKMAMISQHSSMNRKGIPAAKKNASENASMIRELGKAVTYQVDQVKSNKTKMMPEVRLQMQTFSGDSGLSQKFDDVVISYYAHAKNMTGSTDDLSTLIQKRGFYQMVNKIVDTPEEKEAFRKLLQKKETRAYNVIKYLTDLGGYPEAQNWLNTLESIQRK